MVSCMLYFGLKLYVNFSIFSYMVAPTPLQNSQEISFLLNSMLPIFLSLQKYFKVIGSWCIVSCKLCFHGLSPLYTLLHFFSFNIMSKFSRFLNCAPTTALQNFKGNMPNTKHNAAKNSASSE